LMRKPVVLEARKKPNSTVVHSGRALAANPDLPEKSLCLGFRLFGDIPGMTSPLRGPGNVDVCRAEPEKDK